MKYLIINPDRAVRNISEYKIFNSNIQFNLEIENKIIEFLHLC